MTLSLAQTCSRQIANYIKYLETHPCLRRVLEVDAEYQV